MPIRSADSCTREGPPLASDRDLSVPQTLVHGARLALAEALDGRSPAVELVACQRSRLADYPNGAAFDPEEMLASVVLAIREERAATAVLSFAPKTALRMIRLLHGDALPARPSEALAGYRRGAGWMLAGMLAALAGRALRLSEPSLHEAPLVTTLLGTHAPPDTAVLSASLNVSGVGACTFTLLMDPKGLEQIAGSG